MKTLNKLGNVLVVSLLLGIGVAQATDISGTISSTLTIFEDSRLVGNVTCTVVAAPCIQFGAPDIELKLNGFIMTGQANPFIGCNPGGPVRGEEGIDTNGQSNVELGGPGLVRLFRDHGILINGGSGAQVDGITVSTNCHNGIEVKGASNSEVTGNIAVRNSSITTLPCGGIEVGGDKNLIQGNRTSGNGLRFPCPGCTDFGIGVFGKGNLIEGNTVTGNAPVGIEVFAGATGNMVNGNVVMGNPPIQVSVLLHGANPTVDIDDVNAAGVNTFADNVCERSFNGAAAACPNFPRLKKTRARQP